MPFGAATLERNATVSVPAPAGESTGVVTEAIDTSTRWAWTPTTDAATFDAGIGSVAADDTFALPPVAVPTGTAASTASTSGNVTWPPLATEATVQRMAGPLDATQPAGSEAATTTRPDGGE